ncbi:MAG TPA: SdrD B-like domain-containing protein, partial [Kiritimatiellia bacterium]|nr:SdrD B-like domain-containing protein [Kiritimatiellia bacterium]
MAQAQVQAISSATVNYETYANTNYNYSTTGGGSSYFPSGTVYNVRFNEGASNHMVLGKVTVGARSFDGVALAGQINIARATNAPIKGLHHIVLYEQLSNSGSNILLKSNYAATMEESLRTRLINHGADNVFSDQGDSNGNNNNIQRIDYMFPDGLPVHSHVEQRGFLVMDRGGNDRFKIAAVKSLDVNGKPASFGPVVSVLETNWGASGISLDTIVLRGYTASGDPQHPSADVDPQPLSGVFLNWQTLGLATNDLFYGYALAGNDSTTNGAYWTQTDNAAYFPTNTSPDSTYGGLDLISGGLMFFDEALNVTLGDRAWEDLNANGVQDVGEPGISNVLVHVFDAASNLAAILRTDTNGVWLSKGHGPGSYYAKYFLPGGYQFTARHVGTNAAADSDADLATGLTAAYAMTNGMTNLTLDAGLFRRAAIGDFAWEDLDGDGQQDAGEPGLSNVVVRLYDAAANVVGTTTSSATGAYAFTNLAPGIYSVGYALPAGYGGTQANAGNDATDSDADPATGRTAPFLLASGQADPTVDAGFARPATLGDKTWADADFDGQQDAGEPALANVVVTLYDAASNAVGTKTSTTAGAYAFTNLLPGIYYVDFAPPAGYQLTKANVGADATDSDPDPLTRRTGAIFLSGGLNNPTVDAGFVAPAALGDKTWVDSDYDGQQDAGEPALANVVVTLYDAASNVVGTKTSTAAGAYAFTNLPPGTYCVGFAPPADYQLTTIDAGADATDSDANPATGRTGPVALTNGQTDLTIDAGFYRPSSVSLKLWKSSALTNDWELGETNDYYLTLQNTGAVALAGVALADVLPPGVSFVAGSAQLVRLTAVSTDPFSETVADLFSTASYANNDGDSNWVGSWAEAGDNNSAASGSVLVRVAGATNALVFEGNNADNDYVTRTNALAPAPGRVYTNVTLGFAYQRQNWDAGDSFTLYVSTNGFAGQSNLVFSVPTTAGTDSGYVSVATNLASRMGATMALRLRAGGNFSNGDRINFDALVFTNQGYDVATNVQTVYGPGVTVAVVSNLAAATPTNLLANFTMAAGTTVTVRIRATLGAPLASTQLVNVAVATNPATPPLTATVTNCAAANAVGDRAWIDADADGLQDAGEAGLSGATVRLYDAGSNLLAATTTAVDGAYAFAYLPSGSYFLEFVVPAGYPTAPRDQGGDDALDSDADGATGRTATFALGGGTNDASRDAGFYQLAALGDHAWEDVDHDGQQDAGEPAIANVVVTLYNAASNALGIATSSASGAYAFANLMPGTYFVSFAPPAGYAFTAANVGDDATDSDPLAGTNRTAFFALASGQTNLTVDAGFNAALAIGDRVWFDSNRDGVQNAYETNGIADVPVAALDTNGVVRAETVTDADGHYRFGGLAGGTYLLRFDLAELNSITVISAVDVGDDDEADSDAICGNVGDYAWSGPVSIAPGQTNLSVDLGITTRGPTRAELAAIWGEWTDGQGRLAWRTSSEFG